jgi:hypothetical protein
MRFKLSNTFFAALAVVLVMVALILPTTVSAQGPATWFIQNAPAANTQATITKAAAGAGVRNVADCVTATFVAGAIAPAAVQVSVVIRDGATGAGAILAQWNMALPATAGASSAPLFACSTGGIGVSGTANTAMTIEFTASGGANTIETVSLKGHRERF